MSDFATPEPRLYIDGKFTPARSGRTYDVIDPATEEVYAACADAGPEDMEAAIAAAARAFDETDWSTNHAFRQRCLQQLREGLLKEAEHLRQIVIHEVGMPIQVTYGPGMDTVLADMQWVIDQIGTYEWERKLGVHEFFGMKSERLVLSLIHI